MVELRSEFMKLDSRNLSSVPGTRHGHQDSLTKMNKSFEWGLYVIFFCSLIIQIIEIIYEQLPTCVTSEPQCFLSGMFGSAGELQETEINSARGPESGEEMVVICGYLSGKKNGEIQIQSL